MTPFSLNLSGTLREYTRPLVMGIVNVTPDSFFDGSRSFDEAALHKRVARLLDEGADMLDVGAYSSRPGADDVAPDEEIGRLRRALTIIRSLAPGIPVSVDTFRADVARTAIEDFGADIVNDISGGDLDAAMFDTVARLGVPYILMHMRGTPATMQTLTEYPEGSVTAGVLRELAPKVERLNRLGVADIIIDPGFGFSKTTDQNYDLLRVIGLIADTFGLPVLAGLSRKSMFYKPLGLSPADVIPATTAANTIALLQGAAILRVHDVAAARQAVDVVCRTTDLPLYSAIP